MKLLNKKSIAALALLGAMTAGTASAMTTITMPLSSVVGVNSADLQIHVEDGVAKLFGTVESRTEAELAQSYVEKIDGVNKVFNQVIIN